MAEMTIKRFSVMSVAKIYALLMFVVGLIIGVIYGLIVIVFGAAMLAMVPNNESSTAGGVGSVVMGLVLMIVIPLAYGTLGFISGVISALIYNAAAGIIGGVRFELEGSGPAYAPPPQPHQWTPHQYPAQ